MSVKSIKNEQVEFKMTERKSRFKATQSRHEASFVLPVCARTVFDTPH